MTKIIIIAYTGITMFLSVLRIIEIDIPENTELVFYPDDLAQDHNGYAMNGAIRLPMHLDRF